ncbi:E3 ubiquitin ligase BIG BROTHER-related [Lactuca sativa]|uniref:E3 ubiquitin ligase BIG BROTHER-related n=1 Tax=Lactuca sativa TaxID=4236 RepID=UPI000CBAA15B|nr:E3 ubiquitin ligase BIG BROTHER-related [Lactuca sativa]
MSREIEVHNHHLNGSLPADIPEDLREFLSEVEGVSFEEAILQQASVYQSYQESGRNRVVATDDEHHISDSSCSSEDEDEDDDDDEDEDVDEDADEDEDDGESLVHEIVNSQEVTDEAYARSLQEFGEEYDEFMITEFSGRASGVTESPSTHVSSPDSSQDDIDPDNMRYEELLNLSETIGVESIGLSTERLSLLPNYIYTSGMFSKNKEESCVICQENFKFGKRVISLPCSHQYHSKCISEWLKLKKNCPICQKEVV